MVHPGSLRTSNPFFPTPTLPRLHHRAAAGYFHDLALHYVPVASHQSQSSSCLCPSISSLSSLVVFGMNGITFLTFLITPLAPRWSFCRAVDQEYPTPRGVTHPLGTLSLACAPLVISSTQRPAICGDLNWGTAYLPPALLQHPPSRFL